MNWAEIKTAIEAYVAANWARATIYGENDRVDSPVDTGWLRVQIVAGERRRITMTGSADTGMRYIGVLMLSRAVPAGSGSAASDADLDAFDGLFFEHAIALAGSARIVFGSLSEFQQNPDVVWHQVDYTIPFEADES